MPGAHPGSRANYSIEKIAGATVVHVFDDIDIANASRLGDALFASLTNGRPIVIDLNALNYIDSAGLHIILRVFQRAEVVRVDAVLVAGGLIRQLVEQVGLDRLVPIVTDTAAALASLNAKAHRDEASTKN